MPAAWRTLVAEALQRRLAETHPGIPVHRARRAEVGLGERPCISIAMGDAEMDHSVVVGEVMTTMTVSVTAYIGPKRGDAEAEDALAAMEASIAAALDGEALAAPDGQDLTLGLFVDAGLLTLYPTEQSSLPMGEVAIALRAQTLLPRGTLTL